MPENFALPALNSTTFTQVPEFQQQAIKDIMERARQQYSRENKYQRYGKARFAPPSKLQQSARQQSLRSVYAPAYTGMRNQALADINQAQQQDIMGPARQEFNQAIASPVVLAQEYANPFQKHVIDEYISDMMEHYKKNVAPMVNANYIMSGSHLSSGRGIAQKEALANFNKMLGRNVNNLKFQGYENAIQNAQAHRNRQLQGAEQMLHGNLADVNRKAIGAQQQQSMANIDQNAQLRNAAVLEALGQQEQAQEQQKHDLAYQEHQNEQNHETQQLANLSAAVRGLPMNTATTTMQHGQLPPQPSVNRTYGGLAMQGAGMLGQMFAPHAHGGRVKKAAGGMLSGVPAGNVDPYAHSEQLANAMEASGSNPMWSWLMHTGAGLAASRAPTAMQALADGSIEGVKGFEHQMAQNQKMKAQGAKLHKQIADSRLVQQNRLQKFELDKESQLLDREYKMGMLDVHKGTLAAKQAKYGQAKAPKIIKGEGNTFFQQDPATGEIRQMKVEGQYGQTPLSKTEQKRYEKILKPLEEGTLESQSDIETIKSMQEKLPNIGYTGNLLGIIPTENLKNFVATIFNDSEADRKAFFSDANSLLPKEMAKIKGAQSDRDMSKWETLVPQQLDPPKTLEHKLKKLATFRERAIQMEEHMRNAEAQGIPSSEAFRTWKEYVNAHPLLEEKKEVGISKTTNVPKDEYALAMEEKRKRGAA